MFIVKYISLSMFPVSKTLKNAGKVHFFVQSFGKFYNSQFTFYNIKIHFLYPILIFDRTLYFAISSTMHTLHELLIYKA